MVGGMGQKKITENQIFKYIYIYILKNKKEEENLPSWARSSFSFLNKLQSVLLYQDKPLKTTDVGDLWSKMSCPFEALLCSSMYSLVYKMTVLNDP